MLTLTVHDPSVKYGELTVQYHHFNVLHVLAWQVNGTLHPPVEGVAPPFRYNDKHFVVHYDPPINTCFVDPPNGTPRG